ncbi:MAG: antibiotic biosynthesis monooxygenase [Devosia sp.]|uniref:putative quinol monooxygenase n=1 Tax=Devosia sp. TaxID=1871048 RepID=UPI001AD01545|nr:putative quinol monooxygenase [Devosia sp.]MBN9315320.1 antibiotic biosynthesis monooxygenase [Devosia sp.]
MSLEPVTIIARIAPKAGRTSQLREVLVAMVAPTNREAGCVVYNLHEHPGEDGLTFSFYEVWLSQVALDEHMKTAHVQGFINRLEELVEGEIEIERIRLLTDS